MAAVHPYLLESVAWRERNGSWEEREKGKSLTRPHGLKFWTNVCRVAMTKGGGQRKKGEKREQSGRQWQR